MITKQALAEIEKQQPQHSPAAVAPAALLVKLEQLAKLRQYSIKVQHPTVIFRANTARADVFDHHTILTYVDARSSLTLPLHE